MKWLKEYKYSCRLESPISICFQQATNTSQKPNQTLFLQQVSPLCNSSVSSTSIL